MTAGLHIKLAATTMYVQQIIITTTTIQKLLDS